MRGTRGCSARSTGRGAPGAGQAAGGEVGWVRTLGQAVRQACLACLLLQTRARPPRPSPARPGPEPPPAAAHLANELVPHQLIQAVNDLGHRHACGVMGGRRGTGWVDGLGHALAAAADARTQAPAGASASQRDVRQVLRPAFRPSFLPCLQLRTPCCAYLQPQTPDR